MRPFVGALSNIAREEDLKSIFALFGDFVYTKILVGKRCGYVQYVERRPAEIALQRLQGQVRLEVHETILKILIGCSCGDACYVVKSIPKETDCLFGFCFFDVRPYNRHKSGNQSG